MNKFILSLMLVMVCLSFVSAEQDSLGTYTQNEDVELLQICGTCTYNNITSIVFPNSRHLIVDEAMTKRGVEYTYTFNQTDLIGVYSVNGFGDLDGTATAWAYDFEITQTGRSSNLDSIWILIIIMIIAGVLIFVGINKESFPPAILGSMILISMALYIWVNGFGEFGNNSILSLIVASANLLVGVIVIFEVLKELK